MQSDDRGVLSWQRLTEADLPLLARWLVDEQVRRWWNHDTGLEAVARDFAASLRGEGPGEDLVVSLDGRPFGLLQRSVIADYPEDLAEFAAVVDVPDGAVELDYLIGEPSMRARGLGARMIAAAMEDTWWTYPTAPAVLVAVVEANAASWRALERAGLRRIAEGRMSPDNRSTTRFSTSTGATVHEPTGGLRLEGPFPDTPTPRRAPVRSGVRDAAP